MVRVLLVLAFSVLFSIGCTEGEPKNPEDRLLTVIVNVGIYSVITTFIVGLATDFLDLKFAKRAKVITLLIAVFVYAYLILSTNSIFLPQMR